MLTHTFVNIISKASLKIVQEIKRNGTEAAGVLVLSSDKSPLIINFVNRTDIK